MILKYLYRFTRFIWFCVFSKKKKDAVFKNNAPSLKTPSFKINNYFRNIYERSNHNMFLWHFMSSKSFDFDAFETELIFSRYTIFKFVIHKVEGKEDHLHAIIGHNDHNSSRINRCVRKHSTTKYRCKIIKSSLYLQNAIDYCNRRDEDPKEGN